MASDPRWTRSRRALACLVAVVCLGGVAMAQDPDDTPESGRREPAPVEVTNVWFPEAVAKEALRKYGAWLPIYVELKNLTGREERATLEVSAKSRFDDDKENAQAFVVRKTVDVQPGAPRRVWINMRSAPSDQQIISLKVSVVREARGSDQEREVVVHRQDLGWADSHDLSASGGRMTAALLVGSNLAQLIPRSSWFRLSQFGNQSALVQDQCRPSALPDTLLGYQAFDVVIVRDLGEERLEPAQITALRHWVFMGGFVVLVASTQGGDLLRTDLARALLGDHYVEPTSTPLTLGEDLPAGAVVTNQYDTRGRGLGRSIGAYPTDVLVKLEAMRSISLEPFEFVDPVTDDLVTSDVSRTIHMLSEDESLLVEAGERSVRLRHSSTLEGARRLYVELRSGRGRVGVVTFNDQTFGRASESTFLAPIWKRIIGSSHGGSPLSTGAAIFAKNQIVEKLRDPARDIGFSFIVALVVIYLLLIGPGIYFFLKRLDRLPWLIWVEPLVVLLYLAVVLVAGYVSKGAITKAREWTLISQRVGDDLAVRESYLSVFAGAERDYQIGSPAGILLAPIFANQSEAAKALGGGRDGEPSLVLEEDSAGHRRLTGLHLKQWEEGYAVNLDVIDVDPDGGIQVDVLGEIRDRAEAIDETNTLHVRLSNRLPYGIRSGIYFHPSGGKFLLPAVAAGATVEVRLERSPEDSPEVSESLERLKGLAKQYGFGPRVRRADISAVLDRPDADYDEEWHTNLRERLDLFLLYGKE